MGKDISFGTFNLYNLQLANEARRRNSSPYTVEEYDAKIRWSASQLQRMDADVIALQELWSQDCLFDMLRAAGLEDRYKPALIKAVGDDWYDIAVAALVRDPWEVRERRVHKKFPDSFKLKKRSGNPEDDEIEVKIDIFSRSILDLEVVNKDHPEIPAIRVFCAHLKSKLPTWLDRAERDDPKIKAHAGALGAALSTIRRTAEATALRIIVTDLMKGTDVPVVVLGDLNDGEYSNTVSIISEQPRYRPFDKSRVGSRNDDGLYAATRLQSFRSHRAVDYTHDYKGVMEVLDHVLVSEQFYDHSRNRLWSFKELKIWNDHLDDDDPATTDHGVVTARFLWDPAD
ncbi:MAG: endonuclease/exonuclease/phosphatase family protein [Pseudomonadota bacterium]